jgi:Amt family ammonium transporter
MDFAGSGIVHLTGGIGALVGTILVKPRTGRFDEGKEDDFAPHDVPMIVLGTIILWFGWYGFNCGSTLGMDYGAGYMAGAIRLLVLALTIQYHSVFCGHFVILS